MDNTHPNSEVILLAHKVRKATQKLAKKLPKETFITSPNLEGYCAIASHALSRILKAYGYCPKIVFAELNNNGGHAWVELDEWIIDLTASQFGEPGEYSEVFIAREIDSNLHRGSFHKEFEECDYGYSSKENWEKYLWNPKYFWDEYFQEWEDELFERLRPRN